MGGRLPCVLPTSSRACQQHPTVVQSGPHGKTRKRGEEDALNLENGHLTEPPAWAVRRHGSVLLGRRFLGWLHSWFVLAPPQYFRCSPKAALCRILSALCIVQGFTAPASRQAWGAIDSVHPPGDAIGAVINTAISGHSRCKINGGAG